jgi:hypothetical protein
MWCIKILLYLDKETCILNLCDIKIQNFNKLVNMGIGLDITIDEFLI